MRKKILAMTILCAMLCSVVLSGCVTAPPDDTTPATTIPQTDTTIPSPAPTTPTTEPAPQPSTVSASQQRLLSTMYCNTISATDRGVMQSFLAEVNLAILQYQDGTEAMTLDMALSSSTYDFQDSKNTFTLQPSDSSVTYRHAIAYICWTLSDNSVIPFDFVVDMETGYLLFMERAWPMMSYTVASTDPSVDPYEILQHFSDFLEDNEYPMPEQYDDSFYYDLNGAWFTEDGTYVESMAFSLSGTTEKSFTDGKEAKAILNFRWPESFGYENSGPERHTAMVQATDQNMPQFYGNRLLYDPQTEELVSYCFNIFPQDQAVILYMNGQYFAASGNGEDPATILARHKSSLYTKTLKTVNWEGDAYRIWSDGSVSVPITVSIHGTIEALETRSYLNLKIGFPDDFRYQQFAIPEPDGYHAYNFLTDDPNDLVGYMTLYDRSTNDGIMSIQFFLNTEKGYFMLYWMDKGEYLTMSTDPSKTPQDVLTHFQDAL